MKPKNQPPAKATESSPLIAPLRTVEFTLLLGQYKRAVFESMYQADDSMNKLLRPRQRN